MVGFISWGRPDYLCSPSSVDPVELFEEALLLGVIVTMRCLFLRGVCVGGGVLVFELVALYFTLANVRIISTGNPGVIMGGAHC